MDSMVALEAKPLASLPWQEIDSAGPIPVLIVPQVMKEIDKRKRDGGLGKRARSWRVESAFNRLKDFRRIATRYDKLARNYLASVCLAAALVWWI
jgi:transposase